MAPLPGAFIVPANWERRNLTKGQQAMVLAMIYSDPSKGGRGGSVRDRASLELLVGWRNHR
jgi:hypothetical protein